MRLLKAFLVVVISNIIFSVSRFYSTISFTYLTVNIISSFSYPASTILYTLIMVLITAVFLGIITWVVRALLSAKLAELIFHSKAELRDVVSDFGLAHFPLIFSAIPLLMPFFLFLNNLSIFLSLFLGIFLILLMYFFFIEIIASYYDIGLKNGLAVTALVELILFLISIPIGFITGHQLLQISSINIASMQSFMNTYKTI